MPNTPCKQKIMRKEVREEEGCEIKNGEAGADGERRLPMDLRNSTAPTGKKVEGPQRRGRNDAPGCDRRAEGRSVDRRIEGQKRGTPLGGEGLAEGHSAKTKLMPKYEPILSEKGWIYPDGRIALTARETRKRLPEMTQEKEFSVVRRGRKSANKKEHKRKLRT